MERYIVRECWISLPIPWYWLLGRHGSPACHSIADRVCCRFCGTGLMASSDATDDPGRLPASTLHAATYHAFLYRALDRRAPFWTTWMWNSSFVWVCSLSVCRSCIALGNACSWDGCIRLATKARNCSELDCSYTSVAAFFRILRWVICENRPAFQIRHICAGRCS
jgi:hypothetical protein